MNYATVDRLVRGDGYPTVAHWARDSDYFQLANGDWMDEAGGPYDIYEQFLVAHEAAQEPAPKRRVVDSGNSDKEVVDVVVHYE